MAWYLWLILAGLFLILEIYTMGFLVFWLSIGALITMIISFFTSNIIIQTSVFVISSAILILATKPLTKKFATPKTVQTNVNSYIGKTAIVTKDINNIESSGQIKLNGELWSALSEDENQIIEKGSEVKVVDINGVKAVVTKILD